MRIAGVLVASLLFLGVTDLSASEQPITDSYYAQSEPEMQLKLYHRATLNDPWVADPDNPYEMDLVATVPGIPPSNSYIFHCLLTGLVPGYYKAEIEVKPAGGSYSLYNTHLWSEP